jgi:hypothetical protein
VLRKAEPSKGHQSWGYVPRSRHAESKASLAVTPGASVGSTRCASLFLQALPVIGRQGVVRGGGRLVVRRGRSVVVRRRSGIVVAAGITITFDAGQVCFHRFGLRLGDAKAVGRDGTPNTMTAVVRRRRETSVLVRRREGAAKLAVRGKREAGEE